MGRAADSQHGGVTAGHCTAGCSLVARRGALSVLDSNASARASVGPLSMPSGSSKSSTTSDLFLRLILHTVTVRLSVSRRTCTYVFIKKKS